MSMRQIISVAEHIQRCVKGVQTVGTRLILIQSLYEPQDSPGHQACVRLGDERHRGRGVWGVGQIKTRFALYS